MEKELSYYQKLEISSIIDEYVQERPNKVLYLVMLCIIYLWNSLPQDDVLVTDLGGFKRRLGILMENRGGS